MEPQFPYMQNVLSNYNILSFFLCVFHLKGPGDVNCSHTVICKSDNVIMAHMIE